MRAYRFFPLALGVFPILPSCGGNDSPGGGSGTGGAGNFGNVGNAGGSVNGGTGGVAGGSGGIAGSGAGLPDLSDPMKFAAPTFRANSMVTISKMRWVVRMSFQWVLSQSSANLSSSSMLMLPPSAQSGPREIFVMPAAGWRLWERLRRSRS